MSTRPAHCGSRRARSEDRSNSGADVQVRQTIVTGALGTGRIAISDGTRIVVGPSSSLLLQDYLFRGDGGTGKLVVSMLGGSFRFITGNMSKSSYEIDALRAPSESEARF